MALALLRLGHSQKEVAKAMSIGYQTWKNEQRLDEEWTARVQEALVDKFRPVLQHAIDLALSVGDDTETTSAKVKAMELVFRHFGKELDREHALDLVERKAELTEKAIGQIGRAMPPVLTTPDAVAAYMAALPDFGDIEDGEVIEDEIGELGTGE